MVKNLKLLEDSYEEIFNSKSDALLHPSIKKQIRDLIEMLQKFYDQKIDPADATENDALEYIPLFCINGLLIAAMLGVTYDEYLMAVDYMITLLDLEEKDDK